MDHNLVLKYTVIKSQDQYNHYCDIYEELVDRKDEQATEEMELLSLLIEKWDRENNTFADLDPIEIIKTLMAENGLKAVDLANMVGLSRGTVSKILNYHKGLSKETIRKISYHFKISQEALNRPYRLTRKIPEFSSK